MARNIQQDYVVTDKASSVVSRATSEINKDLRSTEATGTKTSGGLAAGFSKAQVGIAAVVAVATTLYQTFKKVSDVYGDFEAELANVSTLVDTSEVDMKALQKQILALPVALGSATELTKGLYQALSAGVEPGKAVAFVAESAKVAKAGLSDVFTAVDAGTTIMNAYGQKAESIGKINDLMFTTVKLGKTNFEELAKSIGRVATLAAQAGVSQEAMFAAVAVSTKAGIKTSETMSAMKAAFSNIIKPAGGTADLIDELGLEFSAAALKGKGLVKFLEDVKVATKGDLDVMAKLFGSIEGLNTILALTSETGSKEFAEAMKEMDSAQGTVAVAFEKQIGTYKASIEQLNSAFEKLTIIIGEKIIPPITKLISKFAEFIGNTENLKNSQLMPYFELLVVAFKGVIAALKLLEPIWEAQKVVFKVLVVLMKPFIEILKLFISVYTELYNYVSSTDAFKFLVDSIKAAGEWIDKMGKKVDDFIAKIKKLGTEAINLFSGGESSEGMKVFAEQIAKLHGFKDLKKDLESVNKKTKEFVTDQLVLATIVSGMNEDVVKLMKEINRQYQVGGKSSDELRVKRAKEQELLSKISTTMKDLNVKYRQFGKLSAGAGGQVIIDFKQFSAGSEVAADAELAAKAFGTLKEQLNAAGTAFSRLKGNEDELKGFKDSIEGITDSFKKITGKLEVSEIEDVARIKGKIETLKILKTAYEQVQMAAAKAGEFDLAKDMGKEVKDLQKDLEGLAKDLTEAFADLKEEVPQITVKFMGEGSSVAPLSDKINELAGEMNVFFGNIEEGTPSVKIPFEDEDGRPISDALNLVSRGFEDMFWGAVEGTKTLKESFASMAVSILKELAMIGAKMAIFKAIGGIGGMFGFGSTPYIPGLAGGGTAKGGQPHLVGERGPELFIPGRTGTVVPGSMGGGGGATNLTIQNNVTMEGGGGGSSEGDRKRMGMNIAQMIASQTKMAIYNETRPGGILNAGGRRF